LDGHDVSRTSKTAGLPISPSLESVLELAHIPAQTSAVDRRIFIVCILAVIIALIASFAAIVLMALIGFFTNLFFYGRFSLELTSPADNHLGLAVVAVPIVGGVIVGLMAKFGSRAIRGHGIPEAMEQVLTNESRIPARLTWLKPLSAAIAIGSGGPFGAEGPIIATGGAFGSLLGQVVWTSASERKILLAAGAAAGMAATFGSPVAALLLAVELLLFEFRARSLIPVALATAVAACMHLVFFGPEPMFAMSDVAAMQGLALVGYIVIGAIVGVVAVAVTRTVYAIEDLFERIPVHWMWWPAIGGIVVGAVGYFSPHTLGVGYDNITNTLNLHWTLQAMALLCALKFVSWAFAIGSGTSGGTLAPLLTIGGGLGVLLGSLFDALVPWMHVDPRVAGVVGMAALFGGASRAVFTSIVFAFETTLQPHVLLPVLAGCTAAHLVSSLMMRQSIMTEKILRRGVRVPVEYGADVLDQVQVSEVASKPVISIIAEHTLESVRAWIATGATGTSHQGYPVVSEAGLLMGVLTRRDLLATSDTQDRTLHVKDLLRRPPVLVYADSSVREAVDHMVRHGVGRLPVVDRNDPRHLVGIITRSDALSAYRGQLDDAARARPTVQLRSRQSQRKRG